MKYFKPKLTLSSSIRDEHSLNLSEYEMMLKHLEDYRAMKHDKVGRLFSPVTGSQEAPVKLTKIIK